MNILVLCHEDNLCKELWGYARALPRHGARLMCVSHGTPVDADIVDLIEQCPERPSLILQPESDFPLLPKGLTTAPIRTACFQFDTFAFTVRRMRWAMLFDLPVVFHPGFDDRFRKAGHPGPHLSYHAADRDLFDVPGKERSFDVGWVGSVAGSFYHSRRRVLARLAEEFFMNDWRRFHRPEEMADVYQRSKVVVNIARDDYRQDANMRVFEAMAAGALLITALPTELTAIGFEEGAHFVGYHEENEINEVIRRYLADETARKRIAELARETVLREHTYDCRVKALFERVEEDAGRLLAPARQWPEERVRQRYLEYYAASSCLDCAYSEFRQIARRSLCGALGGASAIVRAWARQSKARVAAKVRRN